MSKKILITSALPYVNNVPHLGNMIGAVLSADVFARFHRLSGHETLFVCGSDEHGTATETKAKKSNMTPQALCDKYYALHKEIYDWFSINFDIFGRTSKSNHHLVAQNIFRNVYNNGFIEERTITQPFSVESNMFLADRYIEGVCPFCGAEDARGDQCDACQKLLTPQQLIQPHSVIDKSPLEFRKTDHLFLRLDKLQDQLQLWLADKSCTDNVMKVTNAWFKDGLRPRAITRDLEWGIKVPEDMFGGKYKNKVFYVWFDAPIGYISITQQLLGDKYLDWWKNSETELYQFMGKDNIPFHSIIFPATLMAANSHWILPYSINSTEYLNYDHMKFSKSKKIGIFGNQAKETGIPADVWRYVLIYYRPESSDTQFTWSGLQERLNNELIANFGNFINRTLSFTQRFFNGSVVKLDTLTSAQEAFYSQWHNEIDRYLSLFSAQKIRDAQNQFMHMSKLCNQFFQQVEPWKTRNDDFELAQKDIAFLNFLVKDLAILCEPFLPNTSKKIFAQLLLKKCSYSELGSLLPSHTIGSPEVLFSKIEDDAIKYLKNKFSGEHKMESSDVELKVGKIIDIKKHEKADKLYVEKIDLGDKIVQVVSGLVPYYNAQDLLGKNVVVVANLKPTKLRGVLSQGMVLAAEQEDKVGLVFAPEITPGVRVQTSDSGIAKEEITFEQFMELSFEAKDGRVFLNQKQLQPHLHIDKNIQNGSIR